MTLSPEKNDIDISSLFYYRKPVVIIDKDAEPATFYMRLVGDAELQRARVKALRDSRKLRDALKNPESDEHLAYIPDVEDLDSKQLVEVILLSILKEISADVIKETKIPFPEELSSDSSLEEQEEYQRLVDEYPKKRELIVREEIVHRAAKAKKELLKKSIETLQKDYLINLRNEMCEVELTRSFYDHIVFFSLYKDSDYKIPLLENFKEFKNFPAEIKDQLLKEYRGLELGMDELKK